MVEKVRKLFKRGSTDAKALDPNMLFSS